MKYCTGKGLGSTDAETGHSDPEDEVHLHGVGGVWADFLPPVLPCQSVHTVASVIFFKLKV